MITRKCSFFGYAAKVKGTKAKIRLGASSGEWKAMVADETARTTFAKNIKIIAWLS